ncbi:MAG: type II toxin-antitoxin system RelE/ParE family toxin [Candidatus Dadabacteria bacterium]|nr:type II toxin-antitoxin system RelE/ParE family toxin [Candidatus Dadabacteria bacterium]
MGRYKLSFKPSAEKELLSVGDKRTRQQIISKIALLSGNPRMAGVGKMAGGGKGVKNYKIRQGDYRIIYSIDDREDTIRVIKIGHRKEVYR